MRFCPKVNCRSSTLFGHTGKKKKKKKKRGGSGVGAKPDGKAGGKAPAERSRNAFSGTFPSSEETPAAADLAAGARYPGQEAGQEAPRSGGGGAYHRRMRGRRRRRGVEGGEERGGAAPRGG